MPTGSVHSRIHKHLLAHSIAFVAAALFLIVVASNNDSNQTPEARVGTGSNVASSAQELTTNLTPKPNQSQTQFKVPSGWFAANNGVCSTSPLSVSVLPSGEVYYWPTSLGSSEYQATYCIPRSLGVEVPPSATNLMDPLDSCRVAPGDCVSSAGGPCEVGERGCIPYYSADAILLRCDSGGRCAGKPDYGNPTYDPSVPNVGFDPSDPFAGTSLGRPLPGSPND